MRVEYDQNMRQFKIFKSQFDSTCTVLSYSAPFQSFEVVSDAELVVTGQFGDIQRYDSDGRLIV